jgi:hypothetical protein
MHLTPERYAARLAEGADTRTDDEIRADRAAALHRMANVTYDAEARARLHNLAERVTAGASFDDEGAPDED